MLNGRSAAASKILVIPALLAIGNSLLAQQPPSLDAQQIMAQTEARAKAAHKAILLDFGASWCGNCHLFERFLTDPTIRPIIDNHFVTVTLITGEHDGDTKHANTPGGLKFEEAVGGKKTGWPYIVMLDAGGKPIVDSFRPDPKAAIGKSNIGYPDSPAEVDWFMQMLQKSAPALSPQETATVHAWLSNHGHG